MDGSPMLAIIVSCLHLPFILSESIQMTLSILRLQSGGMLRYTFRQFTPSPVFICSKISIPGKSKILSQTPGKMRCPGLQHFHSKLSGAARENCWMSCFFYSGLFPPYISLHNCIVQRAAHGAAIQLCKGQEYTWNRPMIYWSCMHIDRAIMRNG